MNALFVFKNSKMVTHLLDSHTSITFIVIVLLNGYKLNLYAPYVEQILVIVIMIIVIYKINYWVPNKINKKDLIIK